MEVEIDGTYARVIDRDEESGFTIFKLRVNNCKEEALKLDRQGNITVKADSIPYYQLGFPLLIKGEYLLDDHGYGPTIIHPIVTEKSMDEVVTANYIAEICRGIGIATAQKIIRESGYGTDVFALACSADAKDTLKRLGVAKSAIREFITNVKRTVEERKLLEWLHPYNVSYASVVKLYETYGDDAKNQLEKYPYTVGKMIGLTFDKMDAIAKKSGIDCADYDRIITAVKGALLNNESKGHTYGLQEDIVKAAQKLLRTSSYPSIIPATTITNHMERCQGIVKELAKKPRVFLKNTFKDELNIARQVLRLRDSAITTPFVPEIVDYVALETGMTYAVQQRNSFNLLRTTGLKILTGGPGTGKTTTILGLIAGYQYMYPEAVVRICAPTGRAAQRASESTGMEAVTAHRLLEYCPYGDRDDTAMMKNENDPIEADFIVVDEVSMADNYLMSKLLSAVKSGGIIILVGDINQLPSVGCGDVLHDLIYSGKVDVCQLTEVYRQAADSTIIKNSRKINLGETDLLEDEDFRIIKCSDQQEMILEISKLEEKYHKEDDKYFAQTLAPAHKPLAGVENLNRTLQRKINESNEGRSLRFGKKRFFLHDKVIMLQNNYNLGNGYYNGDIGEVVSVENGVLTVLIRNEEFIITRDLIAKHIDLSYCKTIHKAQGSEYPVVIISLPHCMSLQRNLLYTGVTRAKFKVAIVEEDGALLYAIAKDQTGQRKTMLMERILQHLK
ncbi:MULTISPECIES: AAA family ATPase [Anaerostipes]|uniref:AAA family ATPase n=1 Tax=Anaerostipes hominis (ex Liu et al. 2021) TaxID=2763018 RepID=A0ABR7FPR5_9FIRM|nr:MULTISPECIES: AAA family ATPase [Anaerostipes]MBC5677204.1 AAA family ATPase [Anaerostipes hominis (ex Liu et al. 2021)]